MVTWELISDETPANCVPLRTHAQSHTGPLEQLYGLPYAASCSIKQDFLALTGSLQFIVLLEVASIIHVKLFYFFMFGSGADPISLLIFLLLLLFFFYELGRGSSVKAYGSVQIGLG